MVSYMDIMTLLLTLFVLLFVYTRVVAPEPAATRNVSGSPPRVEVAREAEMAVLEAERAVVLPPQWLGSFIEPPIPELTVHFADAAEDATVTHPTVAMTATPDAAILQTPDAAKLQESTALATEGSAQAPAIAGELPRRPPVAVFPEPAADLEQTLLAAIKASELGRRVEVGRRQDAVTLEINDQILFDRGSAALKASGEALLAELAKLLAQQTALVSVEGHTDDSPIRNERFASNWELSSARATNVTRSLIAHAVDPTRVRAIGYADTRPRADNASEQGRARNRRVALVLQVPADHQKF